MPVPKRKVSRSRRNNRSSCKFIRPHDTAVCPTCQAVSIPHIVCKECGHYKGVKVLRTKADRLLTRSKKQETQEVKARAHQAVGQTGEKSA
ncbi:MAG: 50S ribosomal protein L32 [bacterium]